MIKQDVAAMCFVDLFMDRGGKEYALAKHFPKTFVLFCGWCGVEVKINMKSIFTSILMNHSSLLKSQTLNPKIVIVML